MLQFEEQIYLYILLNITNEVYCIQMNYELAHDYIQLNQKIEPIISRIKESKLGDYALPEDQDWND